MEYQKKVSQQCKKRRMSLGLTQQDIAFKIGRSIDTIRNFEQCRFDAKTSTVGAYIELLDKLESEVK